MSQNFVILHIAEARMDSDNEPEVSCML